MPPKPCPNRDAGCPNLAPHRARWCPDCAKRREVLSHRERNRRHSKKKSARALGRERHRRYLASHPEQARRDEIRRVVLPEYRKRRAAGEAVGSLEQVRAGMERTALLHMSQAIDDGDDAAYMKAYRQWLAAGGVVKRPEGIPIVGGDVDLVGLDDL